MKLFSKNSFSLLEVIIFVAILSIVLVTAASFVTRLLFNISLNEHRATAGFFADDVKEWLNGEREVSDWNTFHAKASASGITYCINTNLSIEHTLDNLGTDPDTGTTTFPASPCTGYKSIQTGMPPIYKRELILHKNSSTTPTQVTATITITWLEPGMVTPPSLSVRTIYVSPF